MTRTGQMSNLLCFDLKGDSAVLFLHISLSSVPCHGPCVLCGVFRTHYPCPKSLLISGWRPSCLSLHLVTLLKMGEFLFKWPTKKTVIIFSIQYLKRKMMSPVSLLGLLPLSINVMKCTCMPGEWGDFCGLWF